MAELRSLLRGASDWVEWDTMDELGISAVASHRPVAVVVATD